MSILSIHIQNFQSHKNSKLLLHPGVNVIVGQSDSGKSAVIRGLKWLATNRPTGDSLRSHWGGDTEVTLVDKDGTATNSVTRCKKKGVNGYTANDSDFPITGTDVPDTVTKMLNLSALSWQDQMDAPFLLSDTPGEVARKLNAVADLEKIDTTLVNINRVVRDTKNSLLETAQAVRQMEFDLDKYKALDDQLEQTHSLLEIQNRVAALQEKANSIDRTMAQTEAAMEMLEDTPDTNVAETLFSDIENLMEEFRVLSERASNIDHNMTQADATEDMIDDLPDVDAAEGLLGDVENLTEQHLIISDKAVNVAYLATQISNTTERLQAETAELKDMEKTWHEQFLGKCPLCGK